VFKNQGGRRLHEAPERGGVRLGDVRLEQLPTLLHSGHVHGLVHPLHDVRDDIQVNL